MKTDSPPAAPPADPPFVLGELRLGYVHAAVLVLAAVGAVALCKLSPDPNSSSQAGVRLHLPDNLGALAGEPAEISAAEKLILPSDTGFARRIYHSVAGDRIMASIVLAGGEKRSIHRPEVCLPGQGWVITDGRAIPVPMKDGPPLEVMRLLLEREVEVSPGQRRRLKSIFFYWFVGKNTVTPSHWKRVFLTSWDRVVRQVNHRWAYVIVTSIVTDGFVPGGKDEYQTTEMLKQFTAEIAPTFMLTDGRGTSDEGRVMRDEGRGE